MMFLDQELILDLSFPVARARLTGLTHGAWLNTASGEAYAEGRVALIRVGPFGNLPGTSKLVRVRFAEPAPHDHIAVVPLHWEATGVTGRLFPVLDADITLIPASERSMLVLAGTYRPPLDGLGERLDTMLMHHIGAATISSLLRKIAGALTARGART